MSSSSLDIISYLGDFLKSIGVSSIIANIFVLTLLLIIWESKIKIIFDRINYNKKMRQQSKTNINILRELSDYVEVLVCDRLSVYEFHNTNHSFSGKSYLKYSCTYEVTRKGVPPHNIYKKDNPISSYIELNEMIAGKEIVVADVDEDNISNELRSLMKNGDCQSMVLLPILDNNSYTIGFLAVDFTRSKNFGMIDVSELIKTAYKLIGKISDYVIAGDVKKSKVKEVSKDE